MTDVVTEYDRASAEAPPLPADGFTGRAAELRALALALKPTRQPAGACEAVALAGIILAGLDAAGWRLVRR